MPSERDDEREGLTQHICRGSIGDAETIGRLSHARDVAGEQPLGPAGHAVPEALGEQQLGIGATPSGQDREADEGPHRGAVPQLS